MTKNYLGVIFPDEDTLHKFHREGLQYLRGETVVIEENKEKIFIFAHENLTNTPLIEYLEQLGVERFNINADLKTAGKIDILERLPLEKTNDKEPHKPENPYVSDVIRSILTLELESDIFKHVENAEEHPRYAIFADEQAKIATNLNRLIADVLAYKDTDLDILVNQVRYELEDEPIYRRLEQQEIGLNILEENQKEELEELEKEYQEKAKSLSLQLVDTIEQDDTEKEKELKELVKSAKSEYETDRDNLIEHHRQVRSGNQKALEETKQAIESKVFEVMKNLVSFDFESLYNYDKQYREVRSYVAKSMTIDYEAEQKERKEREQKEAERRKLAKKIEEKLAEQEEKTEEERLEPIKEQIEPVHNELSQSNDKPEKSLNNSESHTLDRDEALRQIFGGSTVVNFETGRHLELAQESAETDIELKKETLEQEINEVSWEHEDLSYLDPETFDKVVRQNDTVQFKPENEDEMTEQVGGDSLENTPKEKKGFKVPNFVSKVKPLYVMLGLSVILAGGLTFAILKDGKSSQIASPKETQTTEQLVKNTETTTEKTFILSEKEYQNNLKILSEAGIGMFLNDKGELSGTLQVKRNGNNLTTLTVVDYTQDGTLIVKEADGKETTYDKEWVDNMIKLLTK